LVWWLTKKTSYIFPRTARESQAREKAMNTHPNSVEAIARVIGQLTEAWNTHDVQRAALLFAPDYEGVDVSEAQPRHGQHGAVEWMNRYLRAFPDMQFTGTHTVVQGENAAVMWTARGTHQGRLMNIPPTGLAFAVRGASFLTIKENKILRGHYIWDLAELLRCLKLLPDLSDSKIAPG
jgi:steroid delta-isomerase-like uncharacterized protein